MPEECLRSGRFTEGVSKYLRFFLQGNLASVKERCTPVARPSAIEKLAARLPPSKSLPGFSYTEPTQGYLEPAVISEEGALITA